MESRFFVWGAFSGGEMSVEQRRLQEHTGMASVISRILGREESEGVSEGGGGEYRSTNSIKY